MQDHIAYVDKDGIVLPFVGRILHADANASQVDLGNLNGASTILQRTLDDYQITRFYTAAPAEVAAWMVKVSKYRRFPDTHCLKKYLQVISGD